MIKKYLLLFFGLFFSKAASLSPCRNLENNSCWSVVNNSRKKINISCREPREHNREIFSAAIDAGQLFSEQFPRGWSDGLGFNAAPLDCRLEFAKNGVKELIIPRMGLGARVKFNFDSNDSFFVVVHNYWDKKNKYRYDAE
ncbi:MAG: hypothetical protein KC505_02060 [Myxococcales bacterium]|nr:hypothetical protein [Myxococcales bacterium]USN49984.1 MAG: hypothetical protein H6731_06835 [Myxococcales bacterium]